MDAIAKRINDLYQIKPDLTSRSDLESFWEHTLGVQANQPVKGTRQEVETPLIQVRVYKVVYEAHDGTPIHGWFLLPSLPVKKSYPCIVQFHGYSGSKGEPEDHSSWLLMGYAVFAIDIRGQGGETGNRMNFEFGTTKGWVTQGILDKETCYYKTIVLDGLSAINWVLEQPEIDPEQVIVMGTSQGGGLALMATALHRKVKITVANIPNMCQMDFGIINSSGAVTEAAEFVNRHPDKLDQVLTTLSYFDVMNLAHWIEVPVMVTVGLKDMTCMPETIFAAYNRIASPDKFLQINPFAGHYLLQGHTQRVHQFIERHLEI